MIGVRCLLSWLLQCTHPQFWLNVIHYCLLFPLVEGDCQTPIMWFTSELALCLYFPPITAVYYWLLLITRPLYHQSPFRHDVRFQWHCPIRFFVVVPFDADIVTVEFELFEIDSWEQDDRLKVAHLQRLLSCSFSNTCYSQYGPFFSLDNSPRYPWTERPLI